jgi:hypothetical protein
MTAAIQDRNTPARDARRYEHPVKGGVKIFAGTMVAIDTADTYAKKAATSTTHKVVGRCEETADNTAGADGAINVKVERGCFRFANSAAGDLITRADIGSDCYVVDDSTVAKTNGTNTRSIAGKVRDVDAAGVWVEF